MCIWSQVLYDQLRLGNQRKGRNRIFYGIHVVSESEHSGSHELKIPSSIRLSNSDLLICREVLCWTRCSSQPVSRHASQKSRHVLYFDWRRRVVANFSNNNIDVLRQCKFLSLFFLSRYLLATLYSYLAGNLPEAIKSSNSLQLHDPLIPRSFILFSAQFPSRPKYPSGSSPCQSLRANQI